MLQNISAAPVDGSGHVTATGVIRLAIAVTWDDPGSARIDAGRIHVAWKRSTFSWPANSMVVGGGNDYAVIPDVRDGIALTIRARAEGADGKLGTWSAELVYTPDSGFLDMDGPPSSGIRGGNQVSDGNFELGPNASVWDLVDETATATGSAEIVDAGLDGIAGKFGPYLGHIAITAGAVGAYYRILNLVHLPVSGGDWKRLLVAARRDFDFGDFEARVNTLFYDSGGNYVSGTAHAAILELTSNFLWPDLRWVARFQVPTELDIAAVQLQLEHRMTATGAQHSYWDGLALLAQTFMRSATETTQVDRTDTTPTNLVTLQDFDGGHEGVIHFDGETEVTIEAVCYATVKRGASNITSPARARARLRLQDVGGGTTISIVTAVLVSRMTVQDGSDLGSGGETDVDMRKLRGGRDAGARDLQGPPGGLARRRRRQRDRPVLRPLDPDHQELRRAMALGLGLGSGAGHVAERCRRRRWHAHHRHHRPARRVAVRRRRGAGADRLQRQRSPRPARQHGRRRRQRSGVGAAPARLSFDGGDDYVLVNQTHWPT